MKRVFAALLSANILAAPLVISEQTRQHWISPTIPFEMIDQIFYVGTTGIGVYAIKTSEGCVLIDSGMEESVEHVLKSMTTVGCPPKQVKWMLSSHAHFDHVAAHATIQRRTGARVLSSVADRPLLESGGKKGFHPIGDFAPVKVDQTFTDGEALVFGGRMFRPMITPGHTEGNTAWSIAAKLGGKDISVFLTSSMSVNPGVRLVRNPAWPDVAKEYQRSFDRLAQMKVEVFLGPHTDFFEMDRKRKKKDPRAFIDPEGFKTFVAVNRKAFESELAKQSQAR